MTQVTGYKDPLLSGMQAKGIQMNMQTAKLPLLKHLVLRDVSEFVVYKCC